MIRLFMNEIIGKVQQTEQEAQDIISAAQAEAQQLLQQSSRAAASLIADAKKSADAEVRETAVNAREEADLLRRDLLETAAKQAGLSLEERGIDVPSVIDALTRRVLHARLPGD